MAYSFTLDTTRFASLDVSFEPLGLVGLTGSEGTLGLLAKGQAATVDLNAGSVVLLDLGYLSAGAYSLDVQKLLSSEVAQSDLSFALFTESGDSFSASGSQTLLFDVTDRARLFLSVKNLSSTATLESEVELSSDLSGGTAQHVFSSTSASDAFVAQAPLTFVVNTSNAEVLRSGFVTVKVGDASHVAPILDGYVCIDRNIVGTQSFSLETQLPDSSGTSISDVIAQLRHIVGLSPLSGFSAKRADVDGSGDISISDVISSLRVIVGLSQPAASKLLASDGRSSFTADDLPAELELVTPGDVDSSWGHSTLTFGKTELSSSIKASLEAAQVQVPIVDSIAISSATGIANGLLNAGDLVTVKVTMSEATDVTGTPRVALAIGNDTKYASYAGGSGTTELLFTYTVEAGLGDADGISLSANALDLNGGTLTDVAGNSVVITHTAVAANSSYKVDTTAPTLSITSDVSSLKMGETATLNFNFSEVPSGFAQSDVSLSGGTLSNFAVDGSNPKIYTATFTPTADGSGTASISVASGSYTDSAGNTGVAGATPTLTFDTDAPSVSAVAITSATNAANNYLNAGDVVTVTVTMDEVTIVTGTPRVALTVGDTIKYATYAGGSSSTSLVFTYTVEASQTDADGISIGANALDLNGGTLTDVAGNSAVITHTAVVANSSYKVDTTAPTILSSAFDFGSVLDSSSDDTDAILTVVTSGVENGQVVSLTLGGSTYTASVIDNTAVVTVIAADLRALSQGQVNYSIDVSDAAGNSATTHAGSFAYDLGALDTVAPILVSSAVAADSNSVTLTYSEAIRATDLDATVFALTVGGSEAEISSVSVSGSTVTLHTASPIANGFAVTVSYAGSSSIAVKDLQGNSASDLPTTVVRGAAPASGAYVTDIAKSGNTIIDVLLHGNKWGGALGEGAVLTYSFPSWSGSTPVFDGAYGNSYSSYNEPGASTVIGLNSDQQANVRTALNYWGEVSNLTFVEVPESSSEVGDLRFAFSSAVSGGTWGWGWLPSQAWPSAGDVWVNPRFASESWAPGTDNFMAMLHEIGHALGFKHPFEDSPSISYDDQSLTVMSYTQATGATWWIADGDRYVTANLSPETPMVFDIAAAQYVYGANVTANVGDTVYTFDETSPFFKTIWDASGTDTISLSNFTLNCEIDLQPGSYSTVYYYEYVAPINEVNEVTDNLGIAYDCWIENAIGGSGNDIISGNALANELTGGAGVDTFKFQFGNSSLSACDVITDFAGDKISIYDASTRVSICSAGSDVTGTATIAAYDSSTLIADLSTLSLSSLADAVAAVEAAINAAGTALMGQSGLFNYLSNGYLFVSDGIDGISNEDIVVKLDGKHVGSGASLSSGVLEIGVTDAPTIYITGVGNSNHPENSTYTSVTPQAVDAIGTVTWSVTGIDASLFSVDASTGIVTLTARNYESPSDNGSDNVYNYTLVATDAEGNQARQAVAVTLTDVLETATIAIGNVSSAVTLSENSAYVSSTPSVSGNIGAVTYALSGDDMDLFTVNSSTGVVQMLARDYEAPTDTNNDNIYNYNLLVTDSDGNTASQSVAISVTNIVELALTVDNTSVSVAENSIHPDNSPAISGALTAVTWSISGADADLFNIDTATGDVTFKVAPNFEQPGDAGGNNVYNYILTATDQQSHSASQAIEVRVTDVVESATLSLSNISDASIDENTDYLAAQPSVSGAIGSVIWSLSGDDASLFSVNPSTGVVSMVARNYESPADKNQDNSYNYTLTVTDADNNSADQAVTVSIADVTETNTLVMSAFNIASVQSLDTVLDATNAAELNTAFEFTFSEDIESLVGTIYLKTSDGAVLESFTSSSTGVSISGAVLTLKPNWSLLPSTDYFFEIGSGVVRTASANTNLAIAPTDTAFRSGVETRHSTIAEQFYQVIPGSLGEEQFGDHYTIAVAIDYQDKFEEAHNILTQASDMSSAALYFADTSYANMSMNLSFAPDFVMPYSLWAADSGDIGSTGDIRRLTQASLTELGILAPDVNLIVYNSHGWLKDGNDAGSSFGGGDWATNAWAGMDVIIHEGGHALGMAHSNLYAPYKDDNVSSYGNSWDIQGGGDGFEGQYILPYLRASYDHYKQEGREGLGWIDEAVLLKNPEMGTYRLYAYDDAYFSPDQIHGIAIETTFSDGVIEYENKVDAEVSRSTKAVLTFEHRTTHENLDSGILITRDTYVIGADLDQDENGRLTQDDHGSAVAPLLVGQTFEYDRDKYVTVVNDGEGYVDLVFAEDAGGNSSPDARVTISTDEVNSLDYVDFSVQAFDVDGDSLAYFWQFSDGYKTSKASFSRYFDLDRLGSETSVGVTLVVSDMHGGTKKFSDTIYVGTNYTAPSPVVLGSLPSSATSTTPTLKLLSDAVLVNEGDGSFSLTVSDINGSITTDALVVPVTYAFFDVDGNDVTSANSARLSSLPTTVTIAAGSSSAQLSLQLVDDSTIQETTLLKVTLGAGNGYQVVSQENSVTLQLQDDDRPVVSLSVVDDVATEASKDSAVIEFSRTGDLSVPLTVYYGFAGSATFGADYAPFSGSVEFAAGESKTYLPIFALDDPWGEARETLYIFTTSLDGTYTVDPSAKYGLVQILDNEDLPVVNVWSDGFGVEDMGSDAAYEFTTYYADDIEPSFKISVTGSVDTPLDLIFELSGNATINDDYTLSGATITSLGNNQYKLVADASNTRLYQIFVNPVDDTVSEDSELITLTIIDDASYQTGSKPQADMVLHDNDKGPVVSLSVIQIGSVSEGDGAVDLFKIYADSSLTGDVAYRVTGGSADQGTDFQTIGSIRFSGQRSKTVPITFIDDNVAEGVETIKFELLSGSNYSLSNVNSAVVDIVDNDTHSIKVGFDASTYLLSESDTAGGVVQEIVVKLSSASSDDIYVDYVAAGGTALGMGTDWAFWDPVSDRVQMPGQLHFAAGETSQSLYIKVFQDSITERIEEIDIALKNARNADIDVTGQSVRLIISDESISASNLLIEERWLGEDVYKNDAWSTTAPYESTYTDSFSRTSLSLVETYSRKIHGTITADETGTYYFRLLNDLNDTAQVFLSSDSTPGNKQVLFADEMRYYDWDVVTANLTAGQSYYMEVQQLGDDFDDFIKLEWKAPGDNDFTPVTKSSAPDTQGISTNRYVRFVETELTASEREDVRAVLTLDRPAAGTVRVDLAIEAGAGDFANAIYNVVFAPGELSKSILIQPVADGFDEPAEKFTLAITSVDGALALENSSLTINLTDDPTSWLSKRVVTLDNPANNDVLFNLDVLSSESVTWTIVNGNPQLESQSGNLLPGFGINANGELVVVNAAAFENITDLISLGIKGVLASGDEIYVPIALLSSPATGVQESVYHDFQSNYYSFYWQDWEMAPLSQRTVSDITLSDLDNVAGDYRTTHRFVSLLKAETTGTYKFTIVGKDEPVRLYLGSSNDENSKQEIANYRYWDDYYTSTQVIANAGGNQVDEEQYSNGIDLQAGELYWIEVVSTTNKRSGEVEILWELPSGQIEKIPTANLINPSVTENYAHDWEATNPTLSWSDEFYSDIADTYVSSGDTVNDSTLGLSGVSNAGAEVTLYVNGIADVTATANSSGNWTLTSGSLPEGDNTLSLSVASVDGTYLTSESRTITVKTREILNDARIATLDRTESDLVSNSTLASVNDLTLSPEAGYVAALVDDIRGFGSASANYTDGATSGADILLFSTRDQSQTLITADKTDAMASFGADIIDMVISPSGRYVVYQTSDISNLDSGQSTDFTDGPTNIVIYDVYLGVSKLASHGADAFTSTATSGVIKAVTDEYLIIETEQARSYGSFTGNTSNYTDLIKVDLATGAQHLISHSALSLLASSQADVRFEGVADEGSILVFSAYDASKLVSGQPDNNSGLDYFSVDLNTNAVTRLTPNVTSGASLIDIDESSAFAVLTVDDAADFGFTDSSSASGDYISVDLTDGSVQLLTGTLSDPAVSAAAPISSWTRVENGYFYFWVNDSSDFSDSFVEVSTSLDTLMRSNLETGVVEMVSHNALSTKTALHGYFDEEFGVISSTTGRYVAFVVRMDTDADNGGFTTNNSGRGIFVVDTQTGVVKLANYGLVNGNKEIMDSGSSEDDANKRLLHISDEGNLVFQTSYIASLADFSVAPSLSSPNDHGLAYYDFTQETVKLLNHGVDDKVMMAQADFVGMSNDGLSVYFKAPDATQFGGSNGAFTDSATATDDIFKVKLATGAIELVSGTGGVSYGKAATFLGETTTGEAILAFADVSTVSDAGGTITDNNATGVDLLVTRDKLLDLTWLSDNDHVVGGTRSDDVTSEVLLEIQAFVDPGMSVYIKIDGTAQETVTADVNGLARWYLFGLDDGDYTVALFSDSQDIPIGLGENATLEFSIDRSGSSSGALIGSQLVSTDTILDSSNELFLEINDLTGSGHDLVSALGQSLVLDGELILDLRNVDETAIASGQRISLIEAEAITGGFESVDIVGLEHLSANVSIEPDAGSSTIDYFVLELV